MKLRRTLAVILLATAVPAAGCGNSADRITLSVYSPSGLGSWYTSQFDAFTKQTGIGVVLFEAGSGEVVSRVNSPATWQRLDSGKPVAPADLLVSLPPFIQKAANAGLLQPSGADTTGITSPALDPGGRYVPIVNTALCFIANPAANPRPSTWNDLLRPDLKGKLQYSTPGEAGDGTALLLLLQKMMGKQQALDYLARLQSNNVGPSSSTGMLQSKVDSGEILVANGDVQMNLAAIKNEGYTFDIFFPAMADGSRTTISLPYVAGVTSRTQRPDEAKRLLAFLLSDEAQKAVATQAFGIPARDAIADEVADTTDPLTPAGALKGVTLSTPDWDAALDQLESDVADYKQAIGG